MSGGQMTLDEIAQVAEWAANLPADDIVYADPVRGHIRVGDVIFADLGPVLNLWSYQGHAFSPAVAGELGRALVAWADKAASRAETNLSSTSSGNSAERDTA